MNYFRYTTTIAAQSGGGGARIENVSLRRFVGAVGRLVGGDEGGAESRAVGQRAG